MGKWKKKKLPKKELEEAVKISVALDKIPLAPRSQMYNLKASKMQVFVSKTSSGELQIIII